LRSLEGMGRRGSAKVNLEAAQIQWGKLREEKRRSQGCFKEGANANRRRYAERGRESPISGVVIEMLFEGVSCQTGGDRGGKKD